MIIKDISKQDVPVIGSILPLKKNNIIPIKINKKIDAEISLYEATLAGAKFTRLIFIAIKAEPQIADNIKSNNILF